jgi:hypothetical protein
MRTRARQWTRYQWNYTASALEVGGTDAAVVCLLPAVQTDWSLAFLQRIAQSDPASIHGSPMTSPARPLRLLGRALGRSRVPSRRRSRGRDRQRAPDPPATLQPGIEPCRKGRRAPTACPRTSPNSTNGPPKHCAPSGKIQGKSAP